MSYQVLARKYRPQSFADVAGQEAVVGTLMRALDGGRVAHAFLFTGSRGVGKTTLARILAKCLVCAQGVTSKPCGTCTLCTGVAQGSLVDVVEIDGASNNSVEQVRDLQEVARFQPQLARFRIFIIDEVHMLSTSAFNALLKILEEPPPHVKFVFATTEPHKIPVTILSRCQRYDFKRLPQKVIVARLKQVLALEAVSISDGGLEVIARAAEGGMRDALSLADQVLSFAGTGGATPEQVTEALGIIDRRSIVRAVEAAIGADAKEALAVVDEAWARGHDLRQLLASVAEELRHLCVASATGSVKGFADLTDEELGRIDARAHELDGKDLTRLFGIALDGIDPTARAEDPRLAVELVLLRMCGRPPLAEALAVSEAILRLEALAKGKQVPPLSVTEIARAATLARAPTATPRADAASLAQAPVAPSRVDAAPSRADAPVAPSRANAPVHFSLPPKPGEASGAPSVSGERGGDRAVAGGGGVITSPPTLFDGEDPPAIAEVAPSSAAQSASTDESDERDDDAAPVLADARPAAPVAAVEEEEEAPDPAAGLPLEGVDARLVQFVDQVARTHRPMAMHLDHARLVRVSNGSVELCFPRELHARALVGAVDAPVIKDALEAAFGKGARLCIVAPPADAALAQVSLAEARERALAEAQRALEQHAKSHPVVEKAVALFGGEVRQVKRR
ncbi:MAG: DNA polymerase III subunit gamma/tau [Deltaproteobacteria bacterium]|nr:DNA polymerase III subunit gamma/tau [Deltaproteobacteria bacterium]